MRTRSDLNPAGSPQAETTRAWRLAFALAALALDLSVPPLALLVMLTGVAWLLALLAALVLGGTAALGLASLMLAALVSSVLLAWSGFARDVINLRQLLSAVGYVARKVPLYVKFLFNRQVEWVRSKRDSE